MVNISYTAFAEYFDLLSILSKLNIMYERFHKQILAKRIEFESRRYIQVVYGPRQEAI